MTKYQMKRILEREIRKLNEHIDWKIIRGLPYQPLARRHQRLLNHFAVYYTKNDPALAGRRRAGS